MKYFRIAVLFSLLLSCAVLTLANDQSDVFETSLDKLLYAPSVTVASIKLRTLRESPGIITVITDEEIRNSGARDLIDVLRMVPGFEFGVDVQGNVSLGIRGDWANEGKVTMFVDGQEMVETLFATIQLGNHIPVDLIKKIEIIRGPGSAIYGGFAELAVINIIMKDAKALEGLSVSGLYGQMPKVFGHSNFNMAYGKTLSDDLSLSAALSWGQGNFSDRQFADMEGTTYDMAENSSNSSLYMNIQASYQGLNALFMIDRYHYKQRDEFGIELGSAVSTDFDNYFLELNYNYQITDSLQIKPYFKYKQQIPWKEQENIIRDAYNITAERYTGGLQASYNLTDKINLIAGTDFFTDKAFNHDFDDYFNGEQEISYSNIAGYAQGLVDTPLVNIALGARYENHSQYGSSFVPRLALTKTIDKFHVKLLGSQAFRAPSIENINLNNEIQPEKTTVFELETGYQIFSNLFVLANFFDINLDKPIIYNTDNITGEETYSNYDNVKTRGWEFECRWKENWGYIDMNYSNYVKVENNVDLYEVEQDSSLLLAFPAHKIALNASVKTIKNLSINPSVIFLSERYGYSAYDASGDPVLEKYDPLVLANLYFLYRDAMVKGLDLGIGIYNLFDAKYDFIQPYNGEHPPLTGSGREVILKASYSY